MFRSPFIVNEAHMAESAPVEAVLAFGANLGERAQTICEAASKLASSPGIVSVRLSKLIESVAVTPAGPSPQEPAYLNAVALIQTTLTPRELLQTALRIEQQFGRERTHRWAARTLDIDIVAYADTSVNEPDLVIPHPQAAFRLFVLSPWLELDPEATLSGVGRVADIAAALAAIDTREAEVAR
jgi:2-amino-4-hydroxy-6-hydroxymethyldihydropteridine diphosphokinase